MLVPAPAILLSLLAPAFGSPTPSSSPISARVIASRPTATVRPLHATSSAHASLRRATHVTQSASTISREAVAFVAASPSSTAFHRSVQPITTSRPVAVTSAAAPAASGAPGSLEFLALKDHNDFRALHNASALAWNASLAMGAQGWANQCMFKHSGGPFGENLAVSAIRRPLCFHFPRSKRTGVLTAHRWIGR